MRKVISLVLIAGILPVIATNLSGELVDLAGVLWILSILLFVIAVYMAYKEYMNAQHKTKISNK